MNKLTNITAADIEEMLLDIALEAGAKESRAAIDAAILPNEGVPYKPTTIASLKAVGCEFSHV
jgi:hypothetical protein